MLGNSSAFLGQEQPGLGGGFFQPGVQGPNVANPGAIQKMLTVQEFPPGFAVSGWQWLKGNPEVGPNVARTQITKGTAGPIPPGPGVHGFNVTPSDTASLPAATRYIYVGGTGDLTVLFAGDVWPSFTTFYAVPAGTVLEISITRVAAIGTTATKITGFY